MIRVLYKFIYLFFKYILHLYVEDCLKILSTIDQSQNSTTTTTETMTIKPEYGNLLIHFLVVLFHILFIIYVYNKNKTGCLQLQAKSLTSYYLTMA